MRNARGIAGSPNLFERYISSVLTKGRASSQSVPNSSCRKSQSSPTQRKGQASPTSLSARYSKDLPAERRPPSKNDNVSKGYISLTDSDSEATGLPVKKPAHQPITIGDDDDLYEASAPRRARSPEVDDGLQFSDEEFPELILRAREREQQKVQQKLNATNAFSEQNHTVKGVEILDDIFDSGTTTPVNSDPTIEILITSKMEGTKPLKVKRKLSQRLKEVRLSWCDRQTIDGQPIDQAYKATMFLTWKKIRLYDVTTCSSLGIKLDGRGKLSVDGDGVDAEGRIHLEAWTKEAWEYDQKRRAAKQKREQGGSDEEATEREAKKAVPKTKIIMKGRGMEDFKIAVKATTTIQKMIVAYRNARAVPDDKRVAVYFEGDELEPATEIGQTELEDMDLLEVHIG
jgi:Ubiquitin-2 like Rad60 SUMO-like